MTDLDALDDFEHRLASEVCVLNAAHGRLVVLTVELLEKKFWCGIGFRSPEHWLTIHAGVSYPQARHLVALARRSVELPLTVGALSAGEITLEAAHAIAVHAPAYVEDQAVDLARRLTVIQLRRGLARYRFADDPVLSPGESAPSGDAGSDTSSLAADGSEATAPATLTMYREAGRFELRCNAPADEGAIVESAIQEARDAMFQAGDSHVTNASALGLIARRSLSTVDSSERVDRYRVYVHLETSGDSVVGGRLNGGRLLSQPIMRKLTCDGSLVPIWESRGTPVNVGRAKRVAPRHTRRLVIDRDESCRFPGCGAQSHLEIHHITHWLDGGRTDLDNLVSLCPFHHDAHHRGEFTISGEPAKPPGDPGELAFVDARGRRISRVQPITCDGAPPRPHGAYVSPSGERFDVRYLSFRDPPGTAA